MGPLVNPAALATLASTPGAFRALMGAMPAEALDATGPEGWSARDVLVHVLSRQQPACIDRITAMLSGDDVQVPDIPDEDGMSDLRERSLPELLDAFDEVRGQALIMLRGLSAEQWAHRARHQVAGAITVADIVHHIAYHDLLHLAQATNLLAAPIEVRRGAMRMF